MISLTSLLAAIWAGFWFSGRFVAPIRRLIAAHRLSASGNLNVALPERRGEGDLRRLSQTFNSMTSELRAQRNELVTTNTQLREGRAFMEATLAGVTSGVLGLDEEGVHHARQPRSRTPAWTQPRRHGRQALVTEIVPYFRQVSQRKPARATPNHARQTRSRFRSTATSAHLRCVSHARKTTRAVAPFSPLTTSPNSSAPSAPLPGPTSPSASPTKSRTRSHRYNFQPSAFAANTARSLLMTAKSSTSAPRRSSARSATWPRMVDEFSSFARMPKPQLDDR